MSLLPRNIYFLKQRLLGHWLRHRFIVILAMICLFVCGFGVWKWIEWQSFTPFIQDSEKRIQVESQMLLTVAQILGGAFLLLSLYLTWRTVNISQEGQITERFIKAIELLGDNTSISKRVGGIYALERIAFDSERDHWTVMEILMAFLRDTIGKDVLDTKNKPLPNQTAEDVHAVIRTIARRRYRYKQGEKHALLLENLHLENADFYEAHLEGARLNETNLKGASFRKAHLEEIRLRKAILRDANLSLAHFEGAKLTGADLTNADLSGTVFFDADLTDCIGLTQDQIGAAKINKGTKLPVNLAKTKNST